MQNRMFATLVTLGMAIAACGGEEWGDTGGEAVTVDAITPGDPSDRMPCTTTIIPGTPQIIQPHGRFVTVYDHIAPLMVNDMPADSIGIMVGARVEAGEALPITATLYASVYGPTPTTAMPTRPVVWNGQRFWFTSSEPWMLPNWSFEVDPAGQRPFSVVILHCAE